MAGNPMLLELAKEVRGRTIRMLERVDEPTSRFVPAGLHNMILWHAGHAVVVVEHLAFGATPDFRPLYPDGWFAKFSWDSKPAAVESWPPLGEVVAELRSQSTRLLALIESLTPDRLDAVVGDPADGRTHGAAIVHALHDEARHQGEMHLLAKLSRLGR